MNTHTCRMSRCSGNSIWINITAAAAHFDWQGEVCALKPCENQSIHSSNKLGNSGIHSAPLSWVNQAGGRPLWLEENNSYCVSRVAEWTGGGGREVSSKQDRADKELTCSQLLSCFYTQLDNQM